MAKRLAGRFGYPADEPFRMAKRLAGRFGYPADEPFRVTLHPDRLGKPLRWRKPRTVFVCSMGDLFHEDVSWRFIDHVFHTMEIATNHTFLILTKRPDKLLAYAKARSADFPLPNVWGMVSIENQAAADDRIPLLLQTPFAVRGVSCEPLLGPVDFDIPCLYYHSLDFADTVEIMREYGEDFWVTAGTESGPRRRPAESNWFRDLRDQCQAAGASFFLKQAEIDGKVVKLPELDGRQWIEWPK